MANRESKTYSLTKEIISFIRREARRKNLSESEYARSVFEGHINKVRGVIRYHREAAKEAKRAL